MRWGFAILNKSNGRLITKKYVKKDEIAKRTKKTQLFTSKIAFASKALHPKFKTRSDKTFSNPYLTQPFSPDQS